MKKSWFLPLAALALVAGVGAFVRPEADPQFAWVVFGREEKLRVQMAINNQGLWLEQFVGAMGRSARVQHPIFPEVSVE